MTTTVTSVLHMAVRESDINVSARTITGVVAPYDETSYLVPDPSGERIMRGAFAKSIRQRGSKVPLFLAHDHGRPVGMATEWDDGPNGLAATFAIKQGSLGDELLSECRDGYYGLSVGFKELVASRSAQGVREVREGMLVEVSLTAIPAYDSAIITAVRSATTRTNAVLAALGPRREIDLSPLPPLWG